MYGRFENLNYVIKFLYFKLRKLLHIKFYKAIRLVKKQMHYRKDLRQKSGVLQSGNISISAHIS